MQSPKWLSSSANAPSQKKKFSGNNGKNISSRPDTMRFVRPVISKDCLCKNCSSPKIWTDSGATSAMMDVVGWKSPCSSFKMSNLQHVAKVYTYNMNIKICSSKCLQKHIPIKNWWEWMKSNEASSSKLTFLRGGYVTCNSLEKKFHTKNKLQKYHRKKKLNRKSPSFEHLQTHSHRINVFYLHFHYIYHTHSP